MLCDLSRKEPLSGIDTTMVGRFDQQLSLGKEQSIGFLFLMRSVRKKLVGGLYE